ncbi:hypothetical protein EIP86_000043 [Pleurotus ostreatoroseus]|nr:hypothetical protein EIP86_000043 [Pleurotus ostreatoroseus]
MLSRVASATARRFPHVAPATTRFYSEPSGMNKKEKAHEDQYAREKEKEELRKIKDAIKKKEAELAELHKQREAKEGSQ